MKSIYISKKTGRKKYRVCLYLPEEIIKKLDRWTVQNRIAGTTGKSITQMLNLLL
ncbi:hypothetical protein Geob_0596 [Geotalea daltonii FRC-32]|uniref:CopG family transcriptional regulator n=1 Tax=Geotalea daltonii (strain DSM 22248 / JCM 15807 / FRC-32) TaxID=316067 RepID=B9M0C5_GEODF|nr:hypothetical protein [Geotalea daltonii]ACM18962.1 hypothetical protein Geob_0596 [Geotalea daltonii FRC-32]